MPSRGQGIAREGGRANHVRSAPGPDAHRAIRDLVARIRRETGCAVPNVDPQGPGADARVVMLMLTPGPAVGGAQMTNVLSPTTNSDQSALNLRKLMSEAGLAESLCVFWNAVSWALDRRRDPNPEELARGVRYLRDFLSLVPRRRARCAGPSGAESGADGKRRDDRAPEPEPPGRGRAGADAERQVGAVASGERWPSAGSGGRKHVTGGGGVEVGPRVYCAQCGEPLQEVPDAPRAPCPYCGSLSRNRRVSISASIEPHASLRAAARHGQAGEVKPHLEVRTGADWSRRLRRWVDRAMRVDREGDRYEEKVVDPLTGEVLHEDSGKLSDHTGHGDARRS